MILIAGNFGNPRSISSRSNKFNKKILNFVEKCMPQVFKSRTQSTALGSLDRNISLIFDLRSTVMAPEVTIDQVLYSRFGDIG